MRIDEVNIKENGCVVKRYFKWVRSSFNQEPPKTWYQGEKSSRGVKLKAKPGFHPGSISLEPWLILWNISTWFNLSTKLNYSGAHLHLDISANIIYTHCKLSAIDVKTRKRVFEWKTEFTLSRCIFCSNWARINESKLWMSWRDTTP